MTDTITIEPANKRARNGNVVLTDRICEKRVAKRNKIYDRKCPGLYVSVTTAGVATFSFKFTDPETGKQRTGWLGVYNPETFTVEDARSKVYGLKAMGCKAVAETLRQHKAQKVKLGKTVDEIIEERRAASGLFNWAAEAGRDYVTANPCVNLPKLDPEHPRTRVLSPDEIRIFWYGLDRDDLPWDRKTRLALKFEFVTMLRSGELLAAHRNELFDLDGEFPRFDVPLKRVKKRRMIQQPLSDLAVEIIREALSDDEQQFVFASPLGDMPLNRKAMATALRGTRHKNGKVKSPGICALLGLPPFTPHDLRRTAATLAGDHGSDDAWIAKCLDHAASKKQEQIVPSVTGKVYNHSKRMKEKRAVLDGVAAEIRRIIDGPALRLVA